MATINDFKVKDEDFNDLDIMSLPSRPSAAGMSAAQLQERFDAGAKQVIRPKLNALIDLLNGSEGAANIGVTPIDGVAGYFLQEVLIALKLLLDDKKSIEQADKEIGAKFDTTEAQALVKEITFSESTGVFTITKYDGSKQTIDTAIEKVALDVRLDGQQFVLTLVDGTEQRVDLSAFLTQTEVTSSDTITLAIENGAIVARIASGSVKLAHLNAEVTAYIDAKELAAYQSAQAAAVSEQNALNSANAAEASRQAALACQEQACLCATQASLSQQKAATSESNAATSEQAAKKAQEEAEKAAGEAKAIAGGDFLETPVYDPNGKETDVFKYVDDAMTEKFGEEGKLPVQNGGWYINSDTTEEDKAEAKDILRNHLGMFPMYFHHNNETDLLDISLQSGVHKCTNWKNHPEGDKDSQGIALIFSYLTTINQSWRIVIYYSANNYDRIAYNACVTDVLNNTIIWTGWRKFGGEGDYLPLDGSVPMSCNRIELLNKYGWVFANMNQAQLGIANSGKSSNDTDYRMLGVRNSVYVPDLKNAIGLNTRIDNVNKFYNLFGEHNKPNVKYTGNGSSTTRTVEIGGIGKLLYIHSTECNAIVANHGAAYWCGSTGFTSNSSIIFSQGILTLNTDSSYFNKNGVEYDCWLL